MKGGGMEAKHWAEGACSFLQTTNVMRREVLQWEECTGNVTGQPSPSLPDFSFRQKVLYWQPTTKRGKCEAPRVEAKYLSKALHVLHNSQPGCFRVWDEGKGDVVVATDIKPLCIFLGVDAILQG